MVCYQRKATPSRGAGHAQARHRLVVGRILWAMGPRVMLLVPGRATSAEVNMVHSEWHYRALPYGGFPEYLRHDELPEPRDPQVKSTQTYPRQNCGEFIEKWQPARQSGSIAVAAQMTNGLQRCARLGGALVAQPPSTRDNEERQGDAAAAHERFPSVLTAIVPELCPAVSPWVSSCRVKLGSRRLYLCLSRR